ncbi:MAG: hypothetical protein DMG80_16310 [Acidobacteria bacterium]|jgi:uncharacterized BrkB/YihY/UPF0761 family membrane protein|nr:MAG: hypothetical protein DMG80_16310 [Acidobacteriota bacterium]
MVLVKSALAGLLALIAAFVVLLTLVMLGLFSYSTFHQAEGSVGWDPISLKSPITLVVAVLIFCAGFFWEFRRLTNH